MFAVEPKTDCPHVETGYILDPGFVDGPCVECGDVSENWICLTCRSVCCSRYVHGHMAVHVKQHPDHYIAASFSDLSIWCYACDSYITSPALTAVIKSMLDSKFGAASSSSSASASMSSPPSPSSQQDAAIQQVAAALRTAKRVAVLSGSGVSAESGIPTFRGAGGLWSRINADDVATPEGFARNPRKVWRWVYDRWSNLVEAEPNAAHRAIADLEKNASDVVVMTQNVDGLHSKAGSSQIYELHGNLGTARCLLCSTVFPIPEAPVGISDDPVENGVANGDVAPQGPGSGPGSMKARALNPEAYMPKVPVRCSRCKGPARPHVAWFGERYDEDILETAHLYLEECDIVIVVGTSGTLPVPVELVSYARSHGAFVADLNIEPGKISALAHVFLRGKAGDLLPRILDAAYS